MTVYLLVT